VSETSKQLYYNDIYEPAISDSSLILILFGSASSGKSYFAAQKVILRCLTETGHRFLVIRKVGNTLKDSVFQLLKDVINEFDVYNEFDINKTDKTFLHKPTGNEIICKGLDEPEKIKSVQGITSMWIEEATELTFDDFSQLLLRIRGEKDNYIQYVLSFNPISENHWLKSKLVEGNGFPNKTVIRSNYQHNHYLSEQDKSTLEGLKLTNPLYYQIYCLGDWGVEDKSGKFAYAFDAEKHVSKVPLTFNPDQPLYLSFDFNVNPISCLAAQYYNETTYCLRSIKLENSNIYELCDVIMATFPGALVIVTGDATGRATSALVNDQLNYYKVIKQQLQLTDGQIKVPTINPSLVENRVVVNAVLQTRDIKIDNQHCAPLIYDLTYCEVDGNNKLIKDRANDKRNTDALDTLRYLINNLYKNILRLPKHGVSDSTDY
jgi:phage terminase large subunit